MIDSARLSELRTAEDERFRGTHPRSAALAEEARGSLLAGVPMPWMTRWPGPFPVFAESAAGGHLVDMDGSEYVDLCLGDTGAMTGHALPQVRDALVRQSERGITTMLPSADAAGSHAHGWDHYFERLQLAAQGGDPGTDPWTTGDMS